MCFIARSAEREKLSFEPSARCNQSRCKQDPVYYCDTYVWFFPLQAQQGYADVTVYNAQMVNAQSGHMTVQGIVGQHCPTGSMMAAAAAGQHGAMMVQGQQQVMMQQPGVMPTQG